MNQSAPDRSGLSALVSRLRPVRVLVIGDVFLDRYSDGVVERISPEAGGPIPVPGRRTAAKTRFRATGRHLLRADDEHVAAVSGVDADRLVAEVRRRIESADALILSDYGKGLFLGDLATRLIDVAADAGV